MCYPNLHFVLPLLIDHFSVLDKKKNNFVSGAELAYGNILYQCANTQVTWKVEAELAST